MTSRRLPLAALFVALAAALPLAQVSARNHTANPVQTENARPGSPGWQLDVNCGYSGLGCSPAWHGEIQGYASRQSVAPGQSISFSVSTDRAQFMAQIYRLGWYGGRGGRLVYGTQWMPGHLQRTPTPNAHTGLIACSWPGSFTVKIPSTWVSGVYMVKLVSSYAPLSSYIPFVVTAPASHSSILVVHGDFTDEADNTWGGRSLYTSPATAEVSFARPFVQNVGAGWFFSWEYHLVRWLEAKGYDVTYATDLDISRHPGLLLHHRTVIFAGEDQFWTKAMRDGMDAAVAHGVSLADFGAGTGLWQARLAPGPARADSVLVSYRNGSDPIRKTNHALVTTEWRFPPVNRPESLLTGAMYAGYEGSHPPYKWVVTDPRSWLFRGTGASAGSSIPKIVGQGFDNVSPWYPHPSRLHIVASASVRDVYSGRTHYQSTLYHASSGAWVFDAATNDWAWGLDTFRPFIWYGEGMYWVYPPAPAKPSPLARRITANLLRRFAR